jgi:hypothetical protein
MLFTRNMATRFLHLDLLSYDPTRVRIFVAAIGILLTSDGAAQINRNWLPAVPPAFNDATQSLTEPASGGARVEVDPRYVPLDRQLNRVYVALLRRLPRAQQEQLKQFELKFIHERNALTRNPDAFFEKTRSKSLSSSGCWTPLQAPDQIAFRPHQP